MLRVLLTPTVGVPLVAIFATQAVLTMGAYSVSVVIPVGAVDIGVEPESVGFFVAILYGVAMASGLVAGSLESRFGATRVFQGLLLSSLVAVGLLWSASMAGAVAFAVFLGVATGPMNPTGSAVLSRITTAENRALVFSVKQCATPAGGMLAGSLLPPLMLAFGWQSTCLLMGALAALLTMLMPSGRVNVGWSATTTRKSPGLGEAWLAVRRVMVHPAIRAVTIMGLCLGFIQIGVATYLVVFLWKEIGYSLEQAGLVYASLHVSGIVSRLVLGSIADHLIAARWVLVGIGGVLFVALLLMTQMSAEWSLALVYPLIVAIGASANGWVGLYFAELARLAPPDEVAEVAGASQFFTFGGLVIGPTLFGVLLAATQSYQWCFAVFAMVALLSALALARAGDD